MGLGDTTRGYIILEAYSPGIRGSVRATEFKGHAACEEWAHGSWRMIRCAILENGTQIERITFSPCPRTSHGSGG